MSGKQLLGTLPAPAASALPQLVTRHDVDGLVWELVEGPPFGLAHVATFNALGYVAASKVRQKDGG